VIGRYRDVDVEDCEEGDESKREREAARLYGDREAVCRWSSKQPC
jgi:hypothetical protein